VTFGGEWRLDCNGLNCLVRSKSFILGAANNNSVYTWHPETHWFMKQFQGHSDVVRSLCVVDDNMAISGGGSGDGSIIIWRGLKAE
jgi:WD40 repeat protein